MYLFCTRTGQRYTDDGFNSIWQRYKKKSGVEDVHFHDIRAKALTDAEEQGRDAQKMAGHESKEMTEDYIRRRQIDVIEPLDLIKEK